ncbi:galactose-3-O-sulfotransferase 2-like [Actinia tenebrosa]|uniref:Galactose-3-O-sulfotransferase 2-like n=1 Tax=Actinia tenebrosa TaxID=6105 RepID=A0A6P8HKQ2_ACTTE|nr:galactose-3-O-sulfotransferase 2-like [Actinia tenebrosa]
MRKFRNCRVKRTFASIFVLVIIAAYITLNKSINQNTKRNVRTDERDPYRFQLQHAAWVWNDDVVYVEEKSRKPREVPTDESPQFEVITHTNKSASLAQEGTDYGQNKFLGLEGVEDYILSKDDYREQRKVPNRRIEKCKFPLFNILFLKTHHTGSDIITNILNRFADLRDLRVAIPNGGVSTFYWPARFHWRHLDLSIHDGVLPNILCNHARFNGEIMDQIMPQGTVYLTMLRNPETLFESTFDHEHFTAMLDMFEYDDPIGSFLENPKMHIEHVIKHNMFKDNLNLIKNGMFFDLGLRTADYHKPQVFKDAILDISDKFTLVLIYEHLDESLVMLKRKLCWELDDLLYLKSYFIEKTSYRNFTEAQREQLRNWSKADSALYEYFNRTLWERIANEDNFEEELGLFKAKQRQIEEDCEDATVDDGVFDSDETSSPGTEKMNKYLCHKMTMSAGNYLEYFRTKFAVRKHGKSYTSG